MLAMSSGLRRLLLVEVGMLPHRLWNTTASSRQPLDLLEQTIHGEATKWWNICYPRRFSLASFVILVSLLVSIVILEHHTEVGVPWKISDFLKLSRSPSFSSSTACQAQTKGYKMLSVDSIPSGIMQTTSDLQPRSLWADPIVEAQQSIASRGLLAMPVGFKQRETVDKIIEKFPADNFTVMLFHYDGIVEAWNIFPWRSRVIQVAALNQTKWWFAKRFLHPDIIAPYKYIFIWDEDIGVENFHAGRYLDIVEKESLEISQPALDPGLSEVHHQITVRRPRGKAHRRMFKFRGSGLCFENSTQPPCTGWVEMMVPVFSRAAWRCAWYMIQNDLVHAWGLDMKLGYCAQGDRSKKVGVVDEEYVVHFGIPSLGGLPNKTSKGAKNEPSAPSNQSKAAVFDYRDRGAVRRRSYVEHEIFQKRWKAAANEDQCWVDPYRKL